MKKQKWNEIHRGSKITLKEDTEFETIDGMATIPKGEYFISGFWANAVGLNIAREITEDNFDTCYNKYVIASIDLKKFEEVE